MTPEGIINDDWEHPGSIMGISWEYHGHIIVGRNNEFNQQRY
jgi:hypothetical protein